MSYSENSHHRNIGLHIGPQLVFEDAKQMNNSTSLNINCCKSSSGKVSVICYLTVLKKFQWDIFQKNEKNEITQSIFGNALCFAVGAIEYLYGKARPKFDPENHILRVWKILLLVNGQLRRLRTRSFDIMKISNVFFIWHLDQDQRLHVDLPGDRRTWPPNFIIIFQLFLLILCHAELGITKPRNVWFQ